MYYNFYPGPSSLHPNFRDSVLSAIKSGILSHNHRSSFFSSLYQKCEETLFEKLQVPKGYKLLFASSATECWEIIAQSLISSQESLHIYNGAFGEKSFKTTHSLNKKTSHLSFGVDEDLPLEQIEEYPFINLCQNETSNGTQITNTSLSALRKKCIQSFISVDATSSLGGQYLDLSTADLWYSSVQKCFGLPSGLAILLVSPRAQEKIKADRIQNHYNDLYAILTNREKWQTTHTPNILDIHSLLYTQSTNDDIVTIDQQLKKNKKLISNRVGERFYSKNTKTQSLTTLCVEAINAEDTISLLNERKIILGKGYGTLQKTTYRIANFPSIPHEHLLYLIKNL